MLTPESIRENYAVLIEVVDMLLRVLGRGYRAEFMDRKHDESWLTAWFFTLPPDLEEYTVTIEFYEDGSIKLDYSDSARQGRELTAVQVCRAVFVFWSEEVQRLQRTANEAMDLMDRQFGGAANACPIEATFEERQAGWLQGE